MGVCSARRLFRTLAPKQNHHLGILAPRSAEACLARAPLEVRTAFAADVAAVGVAKEDLPRA